MFDVTSRALPARGPKAMHGYSIASCGDSPSVAERTDSVSAMINRVVNRCYVGSPTANCMKPSEATGVHHKVFPKDFDKS